MQWPLVRSLSVGMRLGVLTALILAVVVISIVGVSRLLSSSSPAGASSDSAREHDPDAFALASQSEQASQRAREVASDAVLRAVYINPETGLTGFGFVSAALAQELNVVASSTQPQAQWEVRLVGVSPLTTQMGPGIDLSALNVGPAAATLAISGHWPGCTPRGLTLAREREALSWYAFCNLPDGSVAMGTVDGLTGAFQPSPAPPARPPTTATPHP